MTFATPLDRGCAILDAARAIITRIHGARPVIKRAGDVAHSRVLDARSTEQRMASVLAHWDTMGAAFAWDRKVSALVRAIAGETRVIS